MEIRVVSLAVFHVCVLSCEWQLHNKNYDDDTDDVWLLFRVEVGVFQSWRTRLS